MSNQTPTEFDVVVFGTLALDLMWRMERLPAVGTYEPILEERRMIGGEAANTAIALAHWGARVALLGTSFGEDEEGRFLQSRFQIDAPEIDRRFLKTEPGSRTPFCACMATPDGNRTMIGLGFDTMQIPTLTEEIARSARFFTADPNAWEAGKKAMLDAKSWGMEVVSMDYSDDESVNRASTVSLTSHAHIGPNLSANDYATYTRQIRDKFDTSAVVTWGERGCFLAEKGSSGDATHFHAYKAPVVTDTTGAGDIFRAGLLFGQIQEWELPECVRFASAAAALNCVQLGGWAGVVSLEGTLRFMQSAELLK